MILITQYYNTSYGIHYFEAIEVFPRIERGKFSILTLSSAHFSFQKHRPPKTRRRTSSLGICFPHREWMKTIWCWGYCLPGQRKKKKEKNNSPIWSREQLESVVRWQTHYRPVTRTGHNIFESINCRGPRSRV